MRFRTLAIAAALSAGITATGSAYAPQKGAERPVVAATRQPRLHRDVAWTAPQGALAALPSWQAMWDRDTEVPLRLWGPAIAAPRTTSDASAAEAFARQMLVQHIGLLAPGATSSDFVLVSNQLSPSGEVRTVGFRQRALGLPVVGGSIAFTFSHDKLSMMSSTALPNVTVRMPAAAMPIASLASSAKGWLSQAGYAVDIKAYGDRVIVPVVHSRGTRGHVDISYRVAETVTVESSRDPGAWHVWLDASNGAPIARESMLHFASGTVLYDTPDRWPGGTRTPKPAPNANHTIAAATATSLLDGTVTWAGTGPASVTPGLVGPTVRVSNKQGALATDTLSLTDGGSVTWSRATEEYADAQLTGFVATSFAKQYTRTRLNPDLAWLNSQIPVVVNESQTCNAYSTGNDIHFYRSGTQCENTGRLADVVYHEFGHSLHAQSIIDGAGSFDGSLSEGLADTLAASITHDHGMGRGFFKTNEPLRDLDPDGYEKKWPDDADGEPHNEGEIIGGTLWDLRKALEAKLGASAGDDRLLKIFYSIMQRASDIPSSYLEALLADDDDGDLSNGTPNQCEINAAFGAHGLADPSVTLGIEPPTRAGYKVSLTVRVPTQTACPPPAVTDVTLTWTPKGGSGGVIPLTAAGENWSANIPTQPDGTVVLYHVTVKLADGSSLQYPQNKADPEYQMYVGNVEKIWCADFEGGLGDWTVGGTVSTRVEFQAGAPMGLAGDPSEAYAGANVLGIDLGGDDGLYSSRVTQFAQSPEIDLMGHTAVRLQYYRWLNVEDGVYDPATVKINDQVVWQNQTSPDQESAGVSHTDREWRFHDIDLADKTATGKVSIKFELTSDQGLEFAGWNVDEVCLVIPGAPSELCGNGNVDTDEACDDGNMTDGDMCSATCQLETDDGGCCSAGTNPAGPLALGLFTLGFVVVRRRRRR
ncbi:MAG TPA: MYXO-CTERM sorting domain-containing protein [Kofleriaceae bacterium]